MAVITTLTVWDLSAAWSVALSLTSLWLASLPDDTVNAHWLHHARVMFRTVENSTLGMASEHQLPCAA